MYQITDGALSSTVIGDVYTGALIENQCSINPEGAVATFKAGGSSVNVRIECSTGESASTLGVQRGVSAIYNGSGGGSTEGNHMCDITGIGKEGLMREMRWG